jgi:hypothetical protein
MPEVDPKRKKKLGELIERMSKGFDENLLDPLLDSINNDPEDAPLPSESKAKAKKIKFQVIKVNDTAQGDTLAAFFGGKIGESFSMAADARRKDPNKIKKGNAYYLKKALGFQFGGDLVNRTRGTFSKDPTDVQDPALGRSGRFSAQVQPSYDIQQGPLQAETDNTNGIDKAFSNLIVRFDGLLDAKDKKNEVVQLGLDLTNEVTEETKEEVKESNKVKKESIKVQEDFIRFEADQKDTSQVAKRELDTEQTLNTTSLNTYDNTREDEDSDEEDDGGERRSLLDFGLDLIDGGSVLGGRSARIGRRGFARGIKRTALRLGGKKLAQRGLVKGGTSVAAKVISGISGKAIIGFLRPIFKRIPIVGGLIDFVVSLALGESVGRAAAKAIGATLGGALGTLIPIPGVGTIAGGIVGDLVGGAVYDAVTGGGPKSQKTKAAQESAVDKAESSSDATSDATSPPEKLASGGFIAGEAGPEYKIDLTSSTGRNAVESVSEVSNSALAGLPFVLGITDTVVSKSGPSAKPVKNFISQEIGPLERLFGIARFNVNSFIGRGTEAIASAAQKIGLVGGNKGSNGVDSQETMNGSPSSTPVTGIPLGEGDTATGKQLHSGLTSRGFSKEEAAAIVGNLWAESGFESGIRNPNGGAYGLMQWKDGRYDKLVEFAAEKNKPASDLEVQLDYIAWELKGGNQYETAQFKKGMAYGPSVADKTRGFAYEVERAHADELQSSMSKRVGAAQSVFNSERTTTPPPPAAPAAPSATQVPEGHIGPVMPQEPPATPLSTHPTMSPPAAEQQAATPAAPNLLLMAETAKGVAIQPVYIQGSNQVLGYKGSQQGFEGKTKTTYYNSSGFITTLDSLKNRRLQLN